MNKREASSKLFFYDLHGDGAKIQVMADARYQCPEFIVLIRRIYALFKATNAEKRNRICHMCLPSLFSLKWALYRMLIFGFN